MIVIEVVVEEVMMAVEGVMMVIEVVAVEVV